MKLTRSQHPKECMKDQSETGPAPAKGLARLSTVLKHSTRLTCACIVLFAAGNHAVAAPLAVGTTIGIDCGSTPTANWNNFGTSATIQASAVRDLKGTIIDGVSITLAAGTFHSPAKADL